MAGRPQTFYRAMHYSAKRGIGLVVPHVQNALYFRNERVEQL